MVPSSGCAALSYYSDRTAGALLAMKQADLHEARKRLLAVGIIAYEPPLYQVLSLPQGGSDGAAPVPQPGACQEHRRGEGPLAISAILRQMMESGNGGQQP